MTDSGDDGAAHHSIDCAAVNAMMPFLPAQGCCGYREFLSYPDAFASSNGFSNITCDSASGRIVEWDMSWHFFETDPCSYTVCPNTILDPLTTITELRYIFNQQIDPSIHHLKSKLYPARTDLTRIVFFPVQIVKLIPYSELNQVPIEPYTMPHLIRIPPEIGKLKSLERLAIVEELPSTMGDLKQMKELYFADIKLKYFPEFIEKLENLEYLSIRDNRLGGPLPTITELLDYPIFKNVDSTDVSRLLLDDNLFWGRLPHEFSSSENRIAAFHRNCLSLDSGVDPKTLQYYIG
ncbi:hypothetical protein HDU67_009796 [Dinochytrium kinnereticum]|nr:hypothetical protein HDU67_009796 [Dinochytrium kinnereticum]